MDKISDLLSEKASKKMAIAGAAIYAIVYLYTNGVTDYVPYVCISAVSGVLIVCQTFIDIKKSKAVDAPIARTIEISGSDANKIED